MTIDNPFFMLYDKVAALIENPVKENYYSTLGGRVTGQISTCLQGSTYSYNSIAAELLERAKFFFGTTQYTWTFTEWCNDHTEEQILFVIEKAGLAYAERQKEKTGEKFNPFLRTLDLMADTRIKLAWNTRGEFELIIPQSACSDYEINGPYSGLNREVAIPTIVDEMARKEDSFCQREMVHSIMLKALKEEEPDTKIDPDKKFWSTSAVFDLMPFDFDKAKGIILKAANIYDELQLTAKTEDSDNPTNESLQLEFTADGLTDAFYG